MDNIKYWIWLSRIEELLPIQKLKLVEKINNPKVLWEMDKFSLISNGIEEKIADKIINNKYRNNLEKYQKYMLDNNIECVTIFDDEYPQKLKEIYDKPIMLYVKGNKNILNNYGLAIVGCRECSSYGEYVAKKISYNLGISNINVISGLAKGIDSCAHIGCLNTKSKTIAVVGCGLDMVYPKENKHLFESIISNGGAIISEYVIGTKPISKNFPARNRIISGISNGVVVIEAKERSGTLITVDFALEQGKDVYVVPGNITSLNSKGTNNLIKQGAKIITNIDDIFK